MTSLEESSRVVLEKAGERFEILVDPFKAYEFRKGRGSLEEVLLTEEIFKSASKGERQSEEALHKAFPGRSPKDILREILLKGRLQIPTALRRRLTEEKRRKVIAEICQMAIDVRTGAPVPQRRVELAMEKLGISVDPFEPVEVQVPEVLKALRREIPLKVEMKKVSVFVPVQETGRVYPYLKRLKAKEEWDSSGNLRAELEVPGARLGEVLGHLAKLCPSAKVDVR